MASDVSFEAGPPSWQSQYQRAIRDPLVLCDRLNLPEKYRDSAVRAANDFPVFAPESYVGRMERGNAQDPLLRQVLPVGEELQFVDGFASDPVGDQNARQRPGLIQKYRGRVLLMVTGICAVHCRYCFRRHYPYDDEPNTWEAWEPALNQIRADSSIHEVILSGGDPLSLSDAKLSVLVRYLAAVPHLQRLRIHTRLPIVIPQRVTDELLSWLTGSHLRPYFVVHANHVNELDGEVCDGFKKLRDAGVQLLNQSVLLRGVNDSFQSLKDLCEVLSDEGVLPYYLSQLDRVHGAAHFEVPIARGKQLIDAVRQHLPGYAVPRYVQEIPGAEHKIVLR